VISTDCNASSGYWPYAYAQHTSINLVPKSASGPANMKTVSAISGTMHISGAPDNFGKEQGCAPYEFTPSVHGEAEG